MPTSKFHITAKAVLRVLIVLTIASAILIQTNPNHLRHVAKLYPGPAPLDLINGSSPSELGRKLMESDHPPTSNTVYHNYHLFSTTTGNNGGGVLSVGLLRFVIDLR